jgi:hypothetical protein
MYIYIYIYTYTYTKTVLSTRLLSSVYSVCTLSLQRVLHRVANICDWVMSSQIIKKSKSIKISFQTFDIIQVRVLPTQLQYIGVYKLCKSYRIRYHDLIYTALNLFLEFWQECPDYMRLKHVFFLNKINWNLTVCVWVQQNNGMSS